MKELIDVVYMNKLAQESYGLPSYSTPMSAAMDLRACIEEPIKLEAGEAAQLIPTGIAIHINNPGIAAIILPRSGKGHKEGMTLGNTVGLIDPDYQGELFVSAFNRNHISHSLLRSYQGDGNLGNVIIKRRGKEVIIKPGERIAQLMFVPFVSVSLNVVESFESATQRGEGGFGSTGR